MVAGGLILSNGATSATLDLAGNFLPQAIVVANNGGSSTVQLETPTSLISIVSTSLPGMLNVNQGNVARTVTGLADVIYDGTLINEGLLEQKVYLFPTSAVENSGTIE